MINAINLIEKKEFYFGIYYKKINIIFFINLFYERYLIRYKTFSIIKKGLKKIVDKYT